MSGIGGIVRLDGAPVSREAIERVADAIAHRGPDGPGVQLRGSAAFAHALLQTTIASPQPLVDRELTIVADASDAAQILAAYREFGHACVSRLEGDFAFAIRDENQRTLFCARDPFGVKPFVYTMLPGRLFAFASEVRALLALDEVPRHLDEQRIADFLAIYFNDAEQTFHRALRRLPGGCTLTLRDGAIAIDRYWSAERVKPLVLRRADRDAQYAEGFREHFTRAVRERMRVADPSQLGAMLSGGLDSTSIACVARDELRAMNAPPLPVFSWIFSDAMAADEREFQQPVLAMGGMRAYTLDSATADTSLWTGVDALLPDGPLYAPNHYLNGGAAKLARSIGVRAILDGTGGDSTISRGAARFVELFLHGRAFTLARELRALAARRGTHESLPRLFVSHVAAPLAPPALLRFNLWLRRRPQLADPGLALLTPRAREIGAARRHRHHVSFSTRGEHVAQFGAPLLAEGLELLDRVFAANGVEGRYPFFDRRLVEYCISLPADQKLADGYSRIVARRAMEGIVPPEIQWRAGKGKPGLHIIPALRASRPVLDDLFVRDPSMLAPYVDIDVLRKTYADFLEARTGDFTLAVRLWSAAILGQWLRRG
ncbi:MAG TPA: asparagine synthase-related protein [Thermoanaerobaculia bacterium]